MIWFIVFVIGAVALGLLVEPFFRTQKSAESIEDADYLAAQIADVERDRAAGLLTDEEADAASIEARRRLLIASETKNETRAAGPFARQAGVMLVAAAPLAAVALYLALGNPDREPTMQGERIAANRMAQPAPQGARPLAESIASLEAKLKDNPDNIDDWVMLADSYANLNRFDEAATAFGRARALAPDIAYLHAAEGEALAMAAGGLITPEARDAFDAALKADASEPRAIFYLALGAYQEGRPQDALDQLVSLYKGAPPTAAWLPTVRSQIEMLASEVGTSLDALGITAPASTTDALEAEIAGGDASYDRWIALIDAYAAAGDLDKAQDALVRAKERYAGAPFVQQELANVEARLAGDAPAAPGATRGPTQEQMQAASQMSDTDRQQMIEGMVAGLAARLAENPDDLEGWTMLARSYSVLGQYDKSASAFEEAIELSPDDIELRLGRAEALLNKLDAAGEPLDETARAAVGDVARLEPKHPFALYFQGLAASQDGDNDTARRYWTELLEAMPADAPETAQVKAMIDAL